MLLLLLLLLSRVTPIRITKCFSRGKLDTKIKHFFSFSEYEDLTRRLESQLNLLRPINDWFLSGEKSHAKKLIAIAISNLRISSRNIKDKPVYTCDVCKKQFLLNTSLLIHKCVIPRTIEDRNETRVSGQPPPSSLSNLD